MPGFGAIGQFAIGEVGTATAEIITADKWFVPLSDPVRIKPGVQSAAQPFTFLHPNPLVSFGWLEALSEPKRDKPINPAAYRPDLWMQMAPSPFVATGWFNWLSEPVRVKPALKPGLQQFLAYQANPTTVTPFAWFASLSEPVRIKPGLKANLQQFQTQDTKWIPAASTLIDGWFNWLSEPKRFPRGLAVPYQMSYAAPTRLLPTPNVTVTLHAIEINGDIPVIAINVIKSNPVVSARVSIVEIGNGLSATAVIES